MLLIQFFILAVVLVVWWRLYVRLRLGEITWWEFVEWFLLWCAVALVVLEPNLASYLAAWFGVGRGSDLIVYLALLLVFYLIFRTFVRLEKIERQFTALVRNLALKDADKKTDQQNERGKVNPEN